MYGLVLGFYAAYLTLAVGVRMLVQRMWTGSTGYAGLRAKVGSAEWMPPALVVGSYACGISAPLLSLGDVDRPLPLLDVTSVHTTGVLLFAEGLLLTLWAQLAMGASWRIGVVPEERTDLVETGPFAVVRNPIYSAMLLAQAGIVLCLPNVSAIAALFGLVVGVELQVRIVEEPHLSSMHGAGYANYRRRVGRFLPRLYATAAD